MTSVTTTEHTIQSTEQIPSQDLPVYTEETIPDSAKIIIMVDKPDYDNGGVLVGAYLLPISRILPGSGQTANMVSLPQNDGGIEVAAGEVVPAYREIFDPHRMMKAVGSSAATRAQFLIIGNDPNIDGNVLVMSGGFYTFPEPHNYSIGQRYYLSDTTPGAVVSTPPSSDAQPLFVAVSNTIIQILVEA